MKWKVMFIVEYDHQDHIKEDMKKLHDPPSVILRRVEIEYVKDEVQAPET